MSCPALLSSKKAAILLVWQIQGQQFEAEEGTGTRGKLTEVLGNKITEGMKILSHIEKWPTITQLQFYVVTPQISLSSLF